MQLTAAEQDILDGRHGEALAGILREQVSVGEFFGAERFVEVTNAHFMGDREVFGQAGANYLTRLADAGVTVRVPTTRNAQSVDFEQAHLLAQSPELVEGEKETRVLLRRLGVSTVNTCIGYQSVYQPRLGEHVAWGDTGTVAYANSVLGARTNYESGAAGLAAALTGRTPEYGFHLDENRRANVRVRVTASLDDHADWGALGGLIGERTRGYWNVPAIEVVDRPGPVSDELKHFGASLASYGSMAMYHIVGTTPEAPTFEAANAGRELIDEFEVSQADIDAFMARDLPDGGPVDLVVFTAPQLSFFESKHIADRLQGNKVSDSVTLLLTTNSLTCEALREQGHMEAITSAGGIVLRGTCWYVMDPAAQREHFGWGNLVTNSAKLVNIIRAHGYTPALRRTDECIDAALTGKVAGR
ncbi:aconitase X catalytic domain-containing protein [Pseudonocardia kunmingensis]|uniref:Putative aconitase subunit 1 n=1 Tax=Pseudonocardia kunmingensis TaxID=630975 RepID=A0A543DQL6_9PSEU|nr:aconitase X catalytic domain-containing protein [Pseudonocardia kunmingensis]TQM11589.1 putative aconitase subunit 1 [Pseudonocardia kunmingensis]